MRSRTIATLAVLAIFGLSLSACSAPTSDPPEARSLGVQDLWIVAADEGDSAGFGTFTNTSDAAISIVAVSTHVAKSVGLRTFGPVEANATPTVLPIEEISVPAGGSAVLEPGGEFLSLQDVLEPISEDDGVLLDLTFGDGSTAQVTAHARYFAEPLDGSAPGDSKEDR